MIFEVLIILLLTAIACSIVGVFLVLRNLSMVADAISHTVLLGIVLAFFVTQDLTSPLLKVGAALFGVITVYLIEKIQSTGLVRSDAAIGLIYPALFALAIILISRYASNVHLDTDMVLMGDPLFAPLTRMTILGISIPTATFQIGIVLLINILFISLFYKELKVSTFDKEFSIIAGFSAGFLYYGLMTLVSLTAVTAFDAVGAILVIAFLVGPALSAQIISKRLSQMLLLSAVFAVINVLLGWGLAILLNVSMSGMCAVISLVTFAIILILKYLVISINKKTIR